jgi:hypothetical protein
MTPRGERLAAWVGTFAFVVAFWAAANLIVAVVK